MVRTRSGNKVFHTETSYGRAGRSESTRRRRKRKVENEQSANNATLRRTTRNHTQSIIELDASLATPPSSLARVGATRGARCPITNRPLLDNPCTMSAQSRNLCMPFKLMMGRETKESFADFGLLFKFLDSLSDETTLPIELIGFRAFSCMTNCDLSAQWKGLCKGGAAKVHTLPCTGRLCNRVRLVSYSKCTPLYTMVHRTFGC